MFTLDKNIEKLVFPISIGLLTALVLLLIRSILFRNLNRKAKDTSSPIDDAVLNLINTPSIFWSLAAGLYIGIEVAELPLKLEKPIQNFIYILFIFSITVATANIAGALFRNIMKKKFAQKQTSGLAATIVSAVVYGLGLLAVFSVLGVSIAPLLTALGVGGLAVALALKDTLENMFSGIYLLTDRTLRVGDFIRLDTGQEGVVHDIGWRTTRIQTPNNNTVILPNSKLAQSVVTNFCLPEKRITISLPINLSVDADPTKVESILFTEVKKASEDIVGILSSPEPTVRFNNQASDSVLGFSVNFSVKEYTDQSFALHELKKRILAKLKTEKIPFPRQESFLIHEKQ